MGDIVERPYKCDVTGNPVGTDTVRIGFVCGCQGCRAHREIQRLRAEVERLTQRCADWAASYGEKCSEFEDAKRREAEDMELAAQIAEECEISMALIVGGPDGASIARRQIAAAIRAEASKEVKP